MMLLKKSGELPGRASPRDQDDRDRGRGQDHERVLRGGLPLLAPERRTEVRSHDGPKDRADERVHGSEHALLNLSTGLAATTPPRDDFEPSSPKLARTFGSRKFERTTSPREANGRD